MILRCLFLLCLSPFTLPAATALFRLHAVSADGSPAARPIEGTALPPIPMREGELEFLRQPCRFSDGRSERYGWDLPVRLDLRRGTGIKLLVRCRNTAPVSYFACYLESGAGWYRSEFSLNGSGSWETVALHKADAAVEGRPGGWAKITRIRICAWRAGTDNTAFDVARPSAVRTESVVCLARGACSRLPAGSAERRLAAQQAKRLDGLFRKEGIRPHVMDDIDLRLGIPSGVSLVVLPHNPGMDDHAAKTLAAFHARGGSLCGFYSIPAALEKAIGIRDEAYVSAESVSHGFAAITPDREALPGTPAAIPQQSWNIYRLGFDAPEGCVLAQWIGDNGEAAGYPAVVETPRAVWMSHLLLNNSPDEGGALLLAMTARASPAVWKEAARDKLTTIGSDIRPGGYEAVVGTLSRASSAAAAEIVRRYGQAASAEFAKAVRNFREGTFLQSLLHSRQADQLLCEAFFRMHSPPPRREFRGAWIHRGYGVRGRSWDTTVHKLASTGFNAAFPFVADASHASFPFDGLAPAPAPAGTPSDNLAACLQACKRYSVQCHAWIACFRLGDSATPQQLAKLQSQARFQRDRKGQPKPGWLCPSHPDNRRHVLQTVEHILRTYDVDGLHLDYVRYASSGHCFCHRCRQAFEDSLGHPVADWPSDIWREDLTARAWRDFRSAQITDRKSTRLNSSHYS